MLEFLIYLLLFTVLTYLVMQTVSSRIIALHREYKRFSTVLPYHVALEAMAHYLLQAPADKESYCTAWPNLFIWHDRVAHKDKGFMVEQGKLYWCQGIFNTVTGAWQAVRKWPLAEGVESVTYSPSWSIYKKRNWLTSLTCLLQADGKSYKRVMMPQERVIV